MTSVWHFPVFMLVSFIAFVGALLTVLRHRNSPPTRTRVLCVAGIVVVGGMCFARIGTTVGLPVWLYYGLPAAVTWVLPPLAFRMRTGEVVRYVPLALLLAPVIHVAFSFLFGWKEYMPFISIPSLWELVAQL